MKSSEIKNSLAVLKDPFNSDSMAGLSVYCFKNDYTGAWTYRGNVKFKNGDTEGEQKFSAEDLGALIKKMEAFVADLERERDAATANR